MNKKTFGMYGLNIDKNFLSAPECECGCGSKGRLVLNTDQDVRDFCGEILYDSECNHCAICVIPVEKQPFIAIKYLTEDMEPAVNIFAYSHDDGESTSLFRDFDNEFHFHQIGMIAENGIGLWDIIEE